MAKQAKTGTKTERKPSAEKTKVAVENKTKLRRATPPPSKQKSLLKQSKKIVEIEDLAVRLKDEIAQRVAWLHRETETTATLLRLLAKHKITTAYVRGPFEVVIREPDVKKKLSVKIGAKDEIPI